MIPVILSGGSGSRLWPVSRASFPKQFCELLDESLFAKTVRRLAPLGAPWVITVREMQTLTSAGMRALGLDDSKSIYEPFARNTAPAIALLCRRFELLGFSDRVVGVFPADHLIDNDDRFRADVLAGEKLAEQGHIVTLGIRPTFPATGYGYIATDGAIGAGLRATGFREKPNEETAREFLARGGFYWNAGMFIFRVSVMIELFKKHASDIWSVIGELKDDNIEAVYSKVRATSIDYAIMERLPEHVCVPCHFGWSDLGSWDAIAEILAERPAPVVAVESRENFVFPHADKTYSFVGVEDLIVIDTADALLIAKRGETELVKQLVDKLRSEGRTKLT